MAKQDTAEGAAYDPSDYLPPEGGGAIRYGLADASDVWNRMFKQIRRDRERVSGEKLVTGGFIDDLPVLPRREDGTDD